MTIWTHLERATPTPMLVELIFGALLARHLCPYGETGACHPIPLGAIGARRPNIAPGKTDELFLSFSDLKSI